MTPLGARPEEIEALARPLLAKKMSRAEQSQFGEDLLNQVIRELTGKTISPTALPAFVRIVFRRRLIDWRRRRKTSAELTDAHEAPQPQQADPVLVEAFKKILPTLNADDRLIIQLAYIEEAPIRVVAEVLGVSKSTADRSIKRVGAEVIRQLRGLAQTDEGLRIRLEESNFR